jgi:hypothetical protein
LRGGFLHPVADIHDGGFASIVKAVVIMRSVTDGRYRCSMIVNPSITNPSIPKDRDMIDIVTP